MQIYALNEKGEKVSLERAGKNEDYFCHECQKRLRLRGGKLRRLHFYHKETSPSCRQNGKSLTHLRIQMAIQNALQPQNCFLEHSFPEIQRIADVFWPQNKIVFEIQCSRISSQEIQSRNHDYAKLGLKVVWILHDQLYNKRRLTAEEKTLFFWPHYYTNINFLGLGKIYDQYFFLSRGSIQRKSPRFSIELQKPLIFEKITFPKEFPHERRGWPIFFVGDLYHQPLRKFFIKKKRRLYLLSLLKPFFADFLEKSTD